MKIKHYPGRAIEANLSMEKHNSMGLLYEANWLNASERIQEAPMTTLSKSIGNVSALGKYQNQLEHIKAFEAEQKDESITRTIRELNGYKPSTLKIKKNRKQYHDWDNDTKQPEFNENPIYEGNNWHGSQDHLSKPANSTKKETKLRRSQTVIVKQPTSSFSSENYHYNSNDGHGTALDLLDLHQRRLKLKQLEEKHPNNYSTSNTMFTIRDNASANNNTNNNNNNNNNRSNNNNSNYATPKYCDKNLKHNNYEIIDYNDTSRHTNATNISTLTSNNNRMHCYKTTNLLSQYNGNQSTNGMSRNDVPNIIKTETNGKALLNPLARNKSIKINHFDSVTKEPKYKAEIEDGKLCDNNGKSGASSTKKDKRNSFSRMFYNTISAGSKFPRVFLGKSGKSQRPKLNLEELSEAPENDYQEPEKVRRENSFKNPLSSSSSLLSTLSSASPGSSPSSKSSSKKQSIMDMNIIKRKQGSASSSDSDSFLIPRPRLIVPVHTYARKRRTGNLETTQPNCDSNLSKKGNNTSLS